MPRVGLFVIENVRAVDPSRSLDETVDVVVEKGRIHALGPGAGTEARSSENATVLDGSGKWLLPGFVDLHAHLREPGHEYKEDVESGLRAAAAGGYSDVCVMPNTNPVNDTRAITDMLVSRAKDAGGTRLHPIGAITVGQNGHELTEMAELRDGGCVGVSDDGKCVMSSAVMRRALEYAKNFDIPVIQHAEDHDLTRGAQMHEGAVSEKLGLRGWPRVAEDIIVARDLILAEYVAARYHVAHISTHGAVRLVSEAKNRGIPVTCEVTPHHLLLTDESVLGYQTACKVNPPLREAVDVAAIKKALADGTIDAIATDHAPHSPLEKDCEFDAASPGLMGLELCFGLLLELVRNRDITLERFVDALSTAPAKIAGIERPTLEEGSSASFTLVDPERRWTAERGTLHTKSTNTPFLGREILGKVLLTLAGGDVAYDMDGAIS